MTFRLKYIAIATLVLITLIGLNVYQWQNPKVIEVSTGTTEIDSTAWVQRSAYANRESIIDSLRKQNSALAEKVRQTGDEIASYVAVTGKLRLQRDSLEQELKWHMLPNNSLLSERPDSLTADDRFSLEGAHSDVEELQSLVDSTYLTRETFGEGLFQVTGLVQFRGNRFRQQLDMKQLRDLRLDVTTSINDDRSRILTYVTSQDFESLEYKSFTELKPKKKLPWFWIGLASGVAGAVLILD